MKLQVVEASRQIGEDEYTGFDVWVDGQFFAFYANNDRREGVEITKDAAAGRALHRDDGWLYHWLTDCTPDPEGCCKDAREGN